MASTVLLTIISLGIGLRFVAEGLSRREEAFWKSKSREFQSAVRQQSRQDRVSANVKPASVPPNSVQRRWRTAQVLATKDESASCRSFMLVPTDGNPFPIFQAGQAILVGLHDPSQQKRVSRFYSLSSAPGANQYRITVKRVPGGVVSNLLHDTIGPGDEIEIQPPRGKFVCDPTENTPLNLIAAGIGITPALSMALECIHQASTRSIRLFYQLRNSDDAPFLTTLRELAESAADGVDFKLVVWWSRPNAGDIEPGDQVGRVDASGILNDATSTDGDFMICGPETFMTTLAEGLVELGVAEANVKYESFGGKTKAVGSLAVEAEPTTASAEESFEVAFDDQRIRWQSSCESLLELAEANEIEVDSSCREGDCGACVRRLLAGEVKYATEPTCDREPGEVVLCVARPASDLKIEA